MVQRILYEVILFAITIISPNIDKGKFDMTLNGKNFSLEFVKEVTTFDDGDKLYNYTVQIIDNDKTIDKINYNMIDNALYKTYIDKNTSFEIDMINYYKQFNWRKNIPKNKILKDSYNQILQIITHDDIIEIKSPSENLNLLLPKKYFQ